MLVYFSASEAVHDIWIHGRIPRDLVARNLLSLAICWRSQAPSRFAMQKYSCKREESHSNYAIES
jgi:hypothetical protein